jgi:hypothetical protein
MRSQPTSHLPLCMHRILRISRRLQGESTVDSREAPPLSRERERALVESSEHRK